MLKLRNRVLPFLEILFLITMNWVAFNWVMNWFAYFPFIGLKVVQINSELYLISRFLFLELRKFDIVKKRMKVDYSINKTSSRKLFREISLSQIKLLRKISCSKGWLVFRYSDFPSGI